MQRHNIAIVTLLFLSISIFYSVVPSQAEELFRDSQILQTGPHLSIGFQAGDEKIAEKIFTHFTDITEEVKRNVGFYDVPPIKLILAHNEKEFEDYISQFSVIPETSVAVALPQYSLIIIKNPRDLPIYTPPADIETEFFKILLHEYCHIMLYFIVPDMHKPLWFEEGFAQYFADQWNVNKEFLFVSYALKGEMLNLERYRWHYPETKTQLEVFYLQSYYVVKQLINTYSKEQFQDFLDVMRNEANGNFDKLFLSVFGVTPGYFLIQTQESIKPHAFLVVLFTGFGVLWIVILPLLLVIAYIKKRRKARIVEQGWLEEEESEKGKGKGEM
jgi:hypothetical protein